MFGVVSARKNVPLLVHALLRVPDAVLVVAGRVEPDVREFLDTGEARSLRDRGRLVVLDGFLAPAELAAALSAVDLVAVLHDNDSPSGILGEACARHTPVLVPSGGWLARVVQTMGVGVSTPLTVPGVVDGLERARRDRHLLVAATRRHDARIGTTDFTEQLLGPDEEVAPSR